MTEEEHIIDNDPQEALNRVKRKNTNRIVSSIIILWFIACCVLAIILRYWLVPVILFVFGTVILAVILLAVSIIWRKQKWAVNVRIWSAVIIAADILIVASIWFDLTYHAHLHEKSIERECHEELRELANAQMSYKNKELSHCYGTWQDLIDNGLISERRTQSDWTFNYAISLFDIQNPNKNPEDSEHGFRIIAQPKRVSKYEPQLRTFAICEDKVVRLWVGDSDEYDPETTDLENDNLWEPLR